MCKVTFSSCSWLYHFGPRSINFVNLILVNFIHVALKIEQFKDTLQFDSCYILSTKLVEICQNL